MLKKRTKWALCNSIAAIPKFFFGTEQLLQEAEACNEGEHMLSDETIEQLRRYHTQLERLERLGCRDDPDVNWKVEDILDHTVRVHKGRTRVFFKVKWLGGDKQWINMDDVRVHDPTAVIKYGQKENLLRTDGWEWVQAYLPMEEEVLLMASAMNASTKEGHKYKFGVRVPNSVKEALALDRVNGNTFWEDAIRMELKQICEYDTFHVVEDGVYLPGYKRIPYHIVFDVKFDLRHKGRLVAGGNRTDAPQEDVYSGVVSMEAVRLGFIIARMNGLIICAGDVGNAFLYGITKEKYFIIAGPEFGPEYEGK